MSSLKTSLHLSPISRQAADAFMNRQHDRGAAQPSSLYLGVLWDGLLHGVLCFGSPVVNNATHSLGLRSAHVLELRRMALDDVPPRNAESRALFVAARLIHQKYAHLRALLTYCGEEERAMAYRACGWRCVGTNRVFSAVRVGGETMSVKNMRDRYGHDAEKTLSFEKITTPTQKLALGLDEEMKQRIDAVADRFLVSQQKRQARVDGVPAARLTSRQEAAVRS